MYTLNQIRNLIINYGEKIGLSQNSNLYPDITSADKLLPEGANLYIENNEYHYAVTERGVVNKHVHSEKIEDVLYYVFEAITFQIATQYAAAQEAQGENFRKTYFAKQLDLLQKINPVYKLKRSAEIERVLEKYPYKN